jgi:hypothetical protein
MSPGKEMELEMAMQESYALHPAFRFVDSPSWKVDSGALGRHTDAYRGLEALAPALTRRARKALEHSCTEATRDVFAGLRAQCSDELERRFLDELEGECMRLQREEFAWYGAPARAGLVHGGSRARLELARRLVERKYVIDQMRRAAVDKILEIASADLAEFRRRAASGRLRRDDLSVNQGPTVRAIRDVLNEEFDASGILDAVSAYAGNRMRVVGLALELSTSKADWWASALDGQAPSTLYAHLDETRSAPKAIVYLCDVDQGNGPTSCYPDAYDRMSLLPLQEIVGRVIGNVGNAAGSPLFAHYDKSYHQSMSSPAFRRHFMRLPEELRFNSHLGWDVLAGSSFERSLESMEVPMFGRAGTFIAFDGACLLHRGGMVERGERIALQVVFGPVRLANRLRSLIAGKTR